MLDPISGSAYRWGCQLIEVGGVFAYGRGWCLPIEQWSAYRGWCPPEQHGIVGRHTHPVDRQT